MSDTSREAPLQITSRQHVFARSGLKRFAGDHNRLDVWDLESGRRTREGPNAQRFVIHRGWDQRTEAKVMSDIEQRFGIVARRIVKGPAGPLDDAAHATVSEMFSLWRIRFHRANAPLPDLPIGGIVKPERVVSLEVMDQGEHYGIISMMASGLVPGRMMAGPLIRAALDRQAEALAGKRWGVVRAGEGEFVLPDTFGDLLVMPLSPKVCLIADEDDLVANVSGVEQLNRAAHGSARRYLAGRDLAQCLGLPIADRKSRCAVQRY